jgi:hypothetical protein
MSAKRRVKDIIRRIGLGRRRKPPKPTDPPFPPSNRRGSRAPPSRIFSAPTPSPCTAASAARAPTTTAPMWRGSRPSLATPAWPWRRTRPHRPHRPCRNCRKPPLPLPMSLRILIPIYLQRPTTNRKIPRKAKMAGRTMAAPIIPMKQTINNWPKGRVAIRSRPTSRSIQMIFISSWGMKLMETEIWGALSSIRSRGSRVSPLPMIPNK